ncbi:MAG: hypothetical protein AAF989_17225, partial [Planctomycetota bacterium]
EDSDTNAPTPKSTAKNSTENGSEGNDTTAAKTSKKGRGLIGWLGKRSEDDSDNAKPEGSAEKRSQPSAEPTPANASNAAGLVNEEEIDWASLSKAERRRMRKQMKRQGRAA